MLTRNALLTCLTFTFLTVSANADFTHREAPLCATPEQSTKVADFYKKSPGIPTSVAAQMLDMPEAQVVTALPAEQNHGVLTTPDMVKDVFTTIDGWGARTKLDLVYTMDGNHYFQFPSFTPMRQEDMFDGWVDAYADGGNGVHGHLWLSRIRSVHAVDMPGEKGSRTRAISFYLPDGHLAMSIYASMPGGQNDKAALKGFAETSEFLRALPSACQ
ncbi:ChuX/HutX family heme-like substrate-binding protein [Kordiimonas pumila]|uniref:ChuX/HutX family heme-like substrate-binding protein n=1 Tax=Kordiimonas pumila TaxID=2161677 RepID=A0ABV7D4R7_9PROT|nr:ChuX/HutX family heme-like substrate-binding protein [Kordiimonas pumila]